MRQFIISLILRYVKNNRVKYIVKCFIFLNNRNINTKSF